MTEYIKSNIDGSSKDYNNFSTESPQSKYHTGISGYIGKRAMAAGLVLVLLTGCDYAQKKGGFWEGFHGPITNVFIPDKDNESKPSSQKDSE